MRSLLSVAAALTVSAGLLLATATAYAAPAAETVTVSPPPNSGFGAYPFQGSTDIGPTETVEFGAALQTSLPSFTSPNVTITVSVDSGSISHLYGGAGDTSAVCTSANPQTISCNYTDAPTTAGTDNNIKGDLFTITAPSNPALSKRGVTVSGTADGIQATPSTFTWYTSPSRSDFDLTSVCRPDATHGEFQITVGYGWPVEWKLVERTSGTTITGVTKQANGTYTVDVEVPWTPGGGNVWTLFVTPDSSVPGEGSFTYRYTAAADGAVCPTPSPSPTPTSSPSPTPTATPAPPSAEPGLPNTGHPAGI